MPKSKAASDPQLPTDRSSPPPSTEDFRTRMLTSLTEDDWRCRHDYGSIQDPRTSCCVAGEHFLTSNSQEYIKRSLSMDSAVHVDISDITGEGDAYSIPLSLRRCQRVIIAPYSCLLSFIAWRPWFKESLSRRCRFWKFFNCLYPVVVFALIISHYVLEVRSCLQKYYNHQPMKPQMEPLEMDINLNCSRGVLRFFCHAKTIRSTPLVFEDPLYCQHIVPAYIVPSVVHFLAFTYGFYHFRFLECEQLFSLMERVFLQCHSTPGLQKALIRNSRIFFLGAMSWLLCQVCLKIFYNFKIEAIDLNNLESLLYLCYWIAMVLVQGVNVAVAINYCTQCETLNLYIKNICLRLHEKSMELKSAMHEILGVREYISILNGNVAKMMGFCIVNFTQLTISGATLLFMNRILKADVYFRLAFLSLWCIALITPLVQAARLTRIGSKLRQISFEMRVFGYQASSMLELDSFVLFVNGATLRCKLFGVTIRSSTIILTLGLLVFIILTLMAVDLVTVSGLKEFF